MQGNSPDEEYEDPHGECAAEIARLQAELEGVRSINKSQAEALAEQRDMNRKLTQALALSTKGKEENMSERFAISTDGHLRPSPDGHYRLNSDYERLERGLRKIISRYDGFTSAKEMMQIARETLEPHSCPNCSHPDFSANPQTTAMRLQSEDSRMRASQHDAAVESAIRVHGALTESQEKQLDRAASEVGGGA